jgi:putative hydrolase of the HAD superfamily
VRRLANLDAVTLDANGTLVALRDPVPRLARILLDHGVVRTADAIRDAFLAEGRVYAGRAAAAHDPEAFAAMQRECTAVFLGEVGADTVDPAEFAPHYVGAMEFELLPGIVDALARLRRRGLEVAVVANFDLTLRGRLDEFGLGSWFSAVVTPADAGAAKPDRRIFEHALELLAVSAKRALHIGDGAVDEEGAEAAGMHFEWAPVPTALARWIG